MEVQDKRVKKFGNLAMEYLLCGEAMVIEVASSEEEKIYWTTLSHDSIPEHMRALFPDPASIFDFFEESIDTGQIVIPEINKIVLSIKVGRNIREFPIHLSIKELTIEEKLTRKIKSLQKQLESSKIKIRQNPEVIQLQQKLQNKMIAVEELKLKVEHLTFLNQEQEQSNLILQEKNEQLKEKITSLEEKKSVLEREVASLNGTVATQAMIIEQLEREIKENREMVSQLTDYNPSPQLGTLLVFQPAPNSINFNCFTLAGKLLTKNNNSKDGTGRMIPCTLPVPKVGRFHYKFVNRNAGEHPNFRMGLISRANLTTQAYMNGGDVDAVMYYCYNTDQQIIYEGTNKIQGFNIYKGNTITIVIDQQKKQIQWFVERQFKNTSKFTQSMKTSENLYLFVQLWNNGDSLQIVSH